jgi:hypothetical protein
MSKKHRFTDEYDEEEDDFIRRIPGRYQGILKQESVEKIQHDKDSWYWGW